jgi:TRAP-type transport system small permease protein
MHATLMRACGAVAAAVLGLITAMVCFDVISRNLGFRSVVWINEVTEYALPIATLAAAPWLMWRNQHVRLDLLGAVLSPAAQRRVDRVSAALGLVISLLLVWYGMRTLLDSRAAGSIMLKALVFPEWWTYIPVPIGFGLLAPECARRLLWPTSLADQAGPAT